MVNRLVLNQHTLVLCYIGERPDAVVSRNSVICEIKKRLRTYIPAKDAIAGIFNIVLFIIFFIRIDLRISEVDGEVDVVLVLVHVGLDLLR